MLYYIWGILFWLYGIGDYVNELGMFFLDLYDNNKIFYLFIKFKKNCVFFKILLILIVNCLIFYWNMIKVLVVFLEGYGYDFSKNVLFILFRKDFYD